jgi:hypothetical protein
LWFSDYFIITKEYDLCYVGLLNDMFFPMLCHRTAVLLVTHVHNCTMHNTACLHDLTFEILKIYQHVLPFYLNPFNLATNHKEYMHTMWQEYWRLMFFCHNTWISALHTQTYTHTHTHTQICARSLTPTELALYATHFPWSPVRFLHILSLRENMLPSVSNIRKVDIFV